ncbi:MAG: helix-turn-helix domain-containing protein [Clostridia bacterium]|nr:helix-turn-helix domain-containing protein [Clostridia bacterium]
MIEFHINKIFPNMRKFGDVHVYQIGRLLGNPQTQIPAHIQLNYFELTIVTNGQGRIYTNNIPTNVKAGDIYISLPGDAHKIESFDNTPLEFDFFTFKTEYPEYVDKLADISYFLDPTTRVFRDEKINFLISNAIIELNNENDYSEKILECIFNQVILYLIRDTYSGKMNNKNDTKNKSELLCLRIMNYIDTHINSIKSLTETATYFNYDYSYSSSLFKKVTGRTLNRYFQNKKLKTAKLLLLEDKLKINEIAYLLNYSSPYSFSKAFKDKFGISPKAYANSNKPKNN